VTKCTRKFDGSVSEDQIQYYVAGLAKEPDEKPPRLGELQGSLLLLEIGDGGLKSVISDPELSSLFTSKAKEINLDIQGQDRKDTYEELLSCMKQTPPKPLDPRRSPLRKFGVHQSHTNRPVMHGRAVSIGHVIPSSQLQPPSALTARRTIENTRADPRARSP
jgi:hypothetical protein